MKTVYAFMFLSIIVSGCFSSTLVTPSGDKGDLSYFRFNEKFGNVEAHINFRDGQNVSGEGVYVSPDTISWIDPNNHSHIRASLESVRNVVTVNHTVSTLVGLGVGAAVGVVVAISGTSGPQHDGSGAGFFWVIAPPSGAVIGAGIGALIGSPSRYEFPKDTTSGPPGGNK